jgi:dTDP-4-dehydrorhamnose 3,5-epimerase
MKLTPLAISGCYEVGFPKYVDQRGHFVKTFQYSAFAGLSLETDFAETFYTVSGANVIRGMHFQIPPADHAKMVYCVSGAVMDVALDLRGGSPSYGRHAVVELDAERCNGVYLCRGIAHGFAVRQAPAVLLYYVTAEHEPELDCGIRWDSCGVRWPVASPLISARDERLPRLQDYETPFTDEAMAAPVCK